ncbi:MAG: hypothetical protein K8E66_04985, partial [Phycisphaerales bacterium]|nr:hypothetical protein [Phycisphaerales bacterium]
MQSRRQILKGGLGLFAYAAAAGTTDRAFGAPKARVSRVQDAPLKSSRPLAAVSFDPKPRMIGGFPVRNLFEGDDYNDGLDFPFHTAENVFPGGEPPAPTETVDVAVV